MGEHLTHHASDKGFIDDIPAVLGHYSRHYGVSMRTAWKDLNRLIDDALVRKVRGAAPDQTARYALVLDLAQLPADFPKEVRKLLRLHIDDPKVVAKGRQTMATRHAALSECEVVRLGSASRPATSSVLGCGRVHTSPYTREGSPPSPSDRSEGAAEQPLRTPFWGQDLNEEQAAALDFVRSLMPTWTRQRAGGPSPVVPTEAELVELAHLVGLLLRRVPKSEVSELLTSQVASATDLPRVLRWRVSRTLNGLRRAERRAARMRVDDDGERSRAWLATKGALIQAIAPNLTSIAAAARAELTSQRAAQAGPGEGLSLLTEHNRGAQATAARLLDQMPPPGARLIEPEAVLRRELEERFPRPSAPRRWWTEDDHAGHATAGQLLQNVLPSNTTLVEPEDVFARQVAPLPAPPDRVRPALTPDRVDREPPAPTEALGEVRPTVVVWSGEPHTARAAARAYAEQAQALRAAQERNRRNR